jgi:hypothetical protein
MQIGILDLMQLSFSEPEKFSVCFVFRFIKHIITVIIAFDLRKPNFISLFPSVSTIANP